MLSLVSVFATSPSLKDVDRLTMWKQCLHCPTMIGQSSPGYLHFAHVPSKLTRQIPQVSSESAGRSHFHAATALKELIVIFMARHCRMRLDTEMCSDVQAEGVLSSRLDAFRLVSNWLFTLARAWIFTSKALAWDEPQKLGKAAERRERRMDVFGFCVLCARGQT